MGVFFKLLTANFYAFIKMHKQEYHRRAIVINSPTEEEEEEEDEGGKQKDLVEELTQHKRPLRQAKQTDEPTESRRQKLEHLVSPEAIRTAEIEEQEEAMGKSERRPFSGFPSFIYMKYMRERETGHAENIKREEMNHRNLEEGEEQLHDMERIKQDNDDGASYASGGGDDDGMSMDGYSPSQSSSSGQYFSLPSDELATLSSKSRVNMASHLGAAEFDALASLDGISSRIEGEDGKEGEYEQHEEAKSHGNTSAKNKERLKRPPNGYLLFNRDMRRKLLEKSPKMTVAEISKEIGERWKNLPPVRVLAKKSCKLPFLLLHVHVFADLGSALGTKRELYATSCTHKGRLPAHASWFRLHSQVQGTARRSKAIIKIKENVESFAAGGPVLGPDRPNIEDRAAAQVRST